MALARKPPGQQITHRFVNLLTLCMLGTFRCYLPPAGFLNFFFSKYFFQNGLLEIPLECQTVLIQFKPDICRAWTGPKLFANAIDRRHWQIKCQKTNMAATTSENVARTMFYLLVLK